MQRDPRQHYGLGVLPGLEIKVRVRGEPIQGEA